MSALQERLRAALTDALRARDRATVRALRVALAAVANAEAQPASAYPTTASGDSPVAGAVSGLGAAEAPRRELSEDEVRALVRTEVDDFRANGHEAEAAALERHLA